VIAVDSSALVAILVREPEAAEFTDILAQEEACIGAPTLVEIHLVLSRADKGIGPRYLEKIIVDWNIAIIPFGEAEYRLAAEAFDRYGRGSGHGAGLNFGDCLSYATAKSRGIALLYKGGDFGRTDVKKARRR
jgi:ribonuclease VapC